MQKIKVAIIDDHHLFIDGVNALLDNVNDIVLVAKANNSRELFGILKTDNIDVLLLDLNLDQEDGVDILPMVRQIYPHIKIIILTMYNIKKIIKIVMDLGASGYLLKSTDKEELTTAIYAVSNDKTFLGKNVLKLNENNVQEYGNAYIDSFMKFYNLSRREIDVISLIAQGYLNREIAKLLYISEYTVKTHRKNIKKKLTVANTADIVKFAYDTGIIT